MNLKEIIDVLEKQKWIRLTGCWEITEGHRDKYGYIVICIKGIRYRIHRISAAYFHGLNYDDKLQLALHKNNCQNKKCWNPEHLYVGNHSDNHQDWEESEKYRNHNSEKTHCAQGHSFSGPNLKTIDGKRRCRECIKLAARRYSRRKNKVSPNKHRV